MRKRALIAVIALALVVPPAVLGAKASATSKQDTAVAYFDSPGGTECVILTLWQGMYRPIGSDTWSYGQGFDVQLAGEGCSPTTASNGASLDPAEFRILGLSAAYLESSIELDGRTVDLDVAWVAVGTPRYASEQHEDWSFVGKDVAAHLTGTIVVDGTPWDAQDDTAILRTFSISKNYS